MPRYHQAPWDYDCTYKHCCPHLQGLSTAWVFKEYQQSSFEHLDHWRFRDDQLQELDNALAYIKDLEKENEELKSKLRALHQRQFKANRRKKLPMNPLRVQRTKRRKNVGPQRDIPDGADEKLIISIKPLKFQLLKAVRTATAQS